MRANYSECYKDVRQFEGGNDDDPQDPGGRTSRGIIQREWNIFRKTHLGRPSDVWQASEADIGAIYHDGEYWMGQFLDDCFSGGDETLFDYGVNSGPGRSQKVLRRCLHLPDNAKRLDVDAAIARLSKDQLKILIRAINAERLAFLKGLPTWKRFGGGWGKRVVQTTAISIHLADSPVGSDVPREIVPIATPDETITMSARGNHAEPTAIKNAIKTGGTAVPVAGGASFWDWITHHQVASVVIIICVVALVVIALKAINDWHKKRSEAPPVGWTPPAELKPS